MSYTDQVFRVGFRIGCTSATVLLLAALAVEGQPRAVIGEGEVTSNSVYVRSGPSTNHYTICKLNAGDRVSIVSEQGEWYEILPPEGAFSLISGEYVDTADDKNGVVNGNNVRVRAGSQLNKNKYTVQAMLSKGAEVTIIGREADGFLRIAPPSGATLWISGNYVELVPDELVKLQRESNPEASNEDPDADTLEGGPRLQTWGNDSRLHIASPISEEMGHPPASTVESSDGATIKPLGVKAEQASKSPFGGLQLTEERFELEQIDAAAREQLQKPLLERSFDDVLKRYRAIAEREEDEVARRYAQLRCEQIDRMMEAGDSVRKMRNRGERTEAIRRDFMAKRMRLPQMSPPVPDGLDAQGELRESALFPPERDPQRYRLIDPNEPTTRTIGYVEIPSDSTIDASKYLGRYVGVRASRTRLQSGGVDPVPIYVASELVLVARTTDAAAVDHQD